jgi:hypothetical protein
VSGPVAVGCRVRFRTDHDGRKPALSDNWGVFLIGRLALLLALLLLTGCTPHYPPAPPRHSFEGLPVSGSLSDAQKAGFTACVQDTASFRCRRTGVMLEGQGPYSAAIDLIGSDGSGGYDHLTLWHDSDQIAVQAVGDALERHGWLSCLSGKENRGDQEIYTRPGAHVRIAIDISYWGKRRLRIIPEWNGQKPQCGP